MQQAKILFFIEGIAPTPAEFKAAQKLGAFVAFRNAQMIQPDGALEIADGVAGEVPKRYADAYPTAKEAIDKFDAEQEKLQKLVADGKAPKVPAVRERQIGDTTSNLIGDQKADVRNDTSKNKAEKPAETAAAQTTGPVPTPGTPATAAAAAAAWTPGR